MPDSLITCPHCGKPIELTAALRHQLEEDFSDQFAAREKELQTALAAREAELTKQVADTKAQLAGELERERAKITLEVRRKLEESSGKQLTELTATLQEKELQLRKAEAAELTLRKRQREIEERERRHELELARKMDEQRLHIVEQTRKSVQEQANLQLQDKEKQLDQMKRTITELRQQSEQGSMQLQGDAAEASLKEQLSGQFLYDRIEDVATGVLGADLLQRVSLGERVVGTIIWESKRTKVFNEAWLGKLKKDQAEAKADIAVLVSSTLPKESTTFMEKSGIWICKTEHALPLAMVLRSQLILLAKSQLATQDRSTKTQQLYHYISGSEFRNRVEQLVVTFVDMQRDLDRESRALAVAIKRRQKQLESLIYGTAGMYGDLQGIIGGALPRIDQLELSEGELEAPVKPTQPGSLFE